MPFTQRHTDKKIHLAIKDDQTLPTNLASVMTRSMGADSVRKIDSGSAGSIFMIKLPDNHNRKEYFWKNEWENDWYSGSAESIIVLSKANECVHHAYRDGSRTSELGKAHIMTLSSEGASKPGVVDVGLIEGYALSTHKGDGTWVAVSRSHAPPSTSDPGTIWHKVTSGVDQTAWPWMISKYTAAP